MDIIDIGLFASYILIVISTLAAIVIPIVQSFGNPESLVKSGLGMGAVLAVFFVSYLFTDADGQSAVVSAGTAKMVGAGIISMYIFIVLAIIGIIYTEISKMLK